MFWQNLKENKCPKCNKAFNYSSFLKGGFIICTSECGFAIGEKRFSEIVNSQINQSLLDKWDKEGGEKTYG